MTEERLDYRRLRDYGLSHPVRSPEFLKWVRSRGCYICGQPSEPHHYCGSTQGLKSSDLLTLPVCREHHRMLEDNPSMNHKLVTDWAMMICEYLESKV